jgi:hypothetical protein
VTPQRARVGCTRGELAFYLEWCRGTDRDLVRGAAELSRFVRHLRILPVSRPGRGQGRPRGVGRIKHILSVVREFYKHAVATRAVDAKVLAYLYEVTDDRHLPAELRPEGAGLAYHARPRHDVRQPRQARVNRATEAEWESMLEQCRSWRDRFLLVLLWSTGLRIGEALGLRRSDLHFGDGSSDLGCLVTGHTSTSFIATTSTGPRPSPAPIAMSRPIAGCWPTTAVTWPSGSAALSHTPAISCSSICSARRLGRR